MPPKSLVLPGISFALCLLPPQDVFTLGEMLLHPTSYLPLIDQAMVQAKFSSYAVSLRKYLVCQKPQFLGQMSDHSQHIEEKSSEEAIF